MALSIPATRLDGVPRKDAAVRQQDMTAGSQPEGLSSAGPAWRAARGAAPGGSNEAPGSMEFRSWQ